MPFSLLKDTVLDKSGRSYVDICIRSAESLLAVLNDILLFSKASAGAIELERIPFNLNSTVEDVLHVVSSNVLPTQDVDVTFFMKPDVPMLLVGDESRLRQVLLNLLSNAGKHRNPSGCYRAEKNLFQSNSLNMAKFRWTSRCIRQNH